LIEVTSNINIRERDLQVSTIRASGPGGQNVNKVSTAIQLRFRVLDSNLPEPVKKRLVKIAGKLATDRGEIIILARRYRTRDQNLADALDRLKQMIRLACRVPKPRRKTKPSVSSNEARLATKKKRGEVKKLRIGKRNPNEM
jgi:ribosome-associated protein